MPDLTLPDNEPTRKQRFMAAVDLSGLTVKEWCERVFETDPDYLRRVLAGVVPGGSELNAAIEATIEKYLPQVGNQTVSRGTEGNAVAA